MAERKALSVTELSAALKQGRLCSAYIIFGSSYHLSSTAQRLIHEKALGVSQDSNSLGLQVFDSASVTAESLCCALKTPSLLGDKSLVLLKAGEKISDDISEAVIDFVADKKPAAVLMLLFPKADARTRLFKAFLSHGCAIDCKGLSREKLHEWINIEARRYGKNIARDAAEFLSELHDGNLDETVQSIQRLCLYVGDSPLIGKADVEQVVAETHEKQIFEFTDAVGRRNLPEAMSKLKKVFGVGTPHPVVLAMLARQFRILAKARDASGKISGKDLASYLGVHWYFADGYAKQAKNFTQAELSTAFKILFECDRAIKSSGISKDRVIEKTVIDLIRRRQPK